MGGEGAPGWMRRRIRVRSKIALVDLLGSSLHAPPRSLLCSCRFLPFSYLTQCCRLLSKCSLYPLLRAVKLGIDPHSVFEDADWALLIGAKPRGPGMERK